MSQVVSIVANAMKQQIWVPDFRDLPLHLRTFRAVYEFEAQVGNGGLWQYFFNSSAEGHPFVIDALEAVEAREIADLTALAIRELNTDLSTLTIEERHAFIDALPEHALASLSALTDRIYASPIELSTKLEQYVLRNREHFSPRGTSSLPEGGAFDD